MRKIADKLLASLEAEAIYGYQKIETKKYKPVKKFAKWGKRIKRKVEKGKN